MVKLAKNKDKSEIQNFIEENFKDYKKCLGVEQRPLTHEELLNRDYYRGRFASLNSKNEYIYNWEDKEIN